METLEKIRNVLGWVIAVVVVGAATNVLSEYVPRYLAVASGLALLSSVASALRAQRKLKSSVSNCSTKSRGQAC